MPGASPTVVVPTAGARAHLAALLDSLEQQTLSARVIVVDNATEDGTAEMLRTRFPGIEVRRNRRNLGFGPAVNLVARGLDGETLVVCNDDVVCEPTFLEEICAPLEDPLVGMVAGVLTRRDASDRIDSAGIELDITLRGWDYLWDRSIADLDSAPAPLGPCGAAAAYRLSAFQDLGGFDDALFAYWEDTDLAIRMREAGWACALASEARARHFHGATLGAVSTRQRELDAFGRGYLLGKYAVERGRPGLRAAIALLDWPPLLVFLVARRSAAPLCARRRGRARGRAAARSRPPPVGIAAVSLSEAVRRQWALVGKRVTGGLPPHLAEASRPT